MNPSETNNNFHNILFVIISFLLLAVGILSFFLLRNADKLEKLENTRHKLYTLATTLKESSEDLTRYCRTYVVTGDSIWEQKYWEVLDIRNGLKPVPDGSKIALHDSLLKLGIAKDEYEKLSLAEKNSNELVWTERTAFNAMKGFFTGASNEFTKKGKPDTLFARRIMFDKKYYDAKDSIMRPMSEFRLMLDKRTSLEIKKQNALNNILLISILVLILITSALSFYAIIVLRKRIILQVSELSKSNKIIKDNEESLIQQNEEIRALLENLKETNAALSELNATKDKFFSIIAHDLKSPLSFLLSFNELLMNRLEDYSPEEIRNLAKMTHDSVKETYKLLENLLAWARIQTGKIHPVPVYIKPSTLIKEIKNIYEPIANNKKIKIEIMILSDDSFCADKEMVRTILRNLIANAIKYSYLNQIVRIETRKLDNSLLFVIADTGVGIEQDSIDKIFHIDSKLSRAGTGGEAGIGLGLILCKEFVEKNNGTIWVESEAGKGSRFMFTLPLSADHAVNA